MTPAAAWEAGLPCGGEIAVLVQPVADIGFAPRLFGDIRAANASGRALLVATDLDTGTSGPAAQPEPDRFINTYTPPRRMLIVGGVDIAQALASIATTAGFAVTVIDPRPMFLTPERFPAVARDDRWPDEAIAALRADGQTAVITLSHDPKIDDPALAAALAAPTGYVAALGSRRSQAARLGRLAERGIAEADLARIEGPAGIAIGAEGPAEIALSIAAGAVAAFGVLKASDTALVLLAAGQGRRFGSDKLLHPIDGEPLGLRSARVYTGIAFGMRVAVCRPGHPLAPMLTALGYIVADNPEADTGMGSSLAVGTREAIAARPAAIMVALADMPYVAPAHVAALLAAFTGGVLASCAAGVTGPPALFGREHFAALLAATGDTGARLLLRDAVTINADAAAMRDVDLASDL